MSEAKKFTNTESAGCAGAVNAVPKGWTFSKIGDYATEVKTKNVDQEPIPVLSVTKYKGFVLSLDYFKKQVFSRDTNTYKVVKRGQFAYATIHLDEGSLGLLDNAPEGQVSPMYTVFKTNSEIDKTFLFNLLKSDVFMRMYPALGQGSIDRRAAIPFKVLADVDFACPPLPEQKKIATILSSVDDVIEETRAQIDKLKDLKTGMMQELLTKGIGHTEFKDSPMGMIPASWEFAPLEEICDSNAPITYGVLKPGPYVHGGKPLLQIRDLVAGTISPDDLHRINDELDYEYRRSRVKAGDIVISLVGTVGRVALIPNWLKESNIHRNLGRIRTSQNKFIYHYLQSGWAAKQLGLQSSGSSQSALNLSSLRQMLVPILPPTESEKITECLDSVDKRIELVSQRLVGHLNVKKALMQDLLTGKVRVNVEDKEAAVG